jgi:hypothetical protein
MRLIFRFFDVPGAVTNSVLLKAGRNVRPIFGTHGHPQTVSIKVSRAVAHVSALIKKLGPLGNLVLLAPFL